MTSLLLNRPLKVPVKTKKVAAKATPMSSLTAAATAPWPTLPGGQTPTRLMAGLASQDWTKAAQSALAPAYRSGLASSRFGLEQGLAEARAQAQALQGAYVAAGGQMPRVGSEYSSLGSVLGDLGKTLGAGITPGYDASRLANVGVEASPFMPDAAGATYEMGTAPGRALAESGYYKDIGTAGEAAAMQMQGREQAMTLQNQLQAKALTDYLGKTQELTTSLLSQVPQTAVALSQEGRARAAGVLSGLQFETEQRMNIQKLLQDYAQMRATAKTNAQKLALDKWAQTSLDDYRSNTLGISQQRANIAQQQANTAQKRAEAAAKKNAAKAGMTPDAYARAMTNANEAAKGFWTGMMEDPKHPGKMIPAFGDNATIVEGTQRDYNDAAAYLQRVYGITKQDALALLNEYYPPGEGGRPPGTQKGKVLTAVGPTPKKKFQMPGTRQAGPFGAVPSLSGLSPAKDPGFDWGGFLNPATPFKPGGTFRDPGFWDPTAPFK